MAVVIGASGLTGDETMSGAEDEVTALDTVKKHKKALLSNLTNNILKKRKLVTPTGFEPVAYRLGICGSIPLTYCFY